MLCVDNIRYRRMRKVISMALIDNLHHDDWQEFLRNCFQYTLKLLKEDRFRYAGSSVDDLKSWLSVGGVARVREHLNNQMTMCRFSSARKKAINDCLEQLIQENQGALQDLIADEIIPTTRQE